MAGRAAPAEPFNLTGRKFLPALYHRVCTADVLRGACQAATDKRQTPRAPRVIEEGSTGRAPWQGGTGQGR